MSRVFHVLSRSWHSSRLIVGVRQAEKVTTPSEDSKAVKPATTERLPPRRRAAARRRAEEFQYPHIPPAGKPRFVNRYVSFSRLADATNSRDPGGVVGLCALLTAEAEKVLGRGHRSGAAQLSS